MILSVNFHLWEPCNMRCRFCFATFQDLKKSILPSGHLPKEQALQVVQELADSGFEKITFAGGEPSLCPWLFDLIKTAKLAGMTTMVVTNGSRLDDAFLKQHEKYLDWIAISIDSLNPETNRTIGRAVSGKTPLTIDYYKSIVKKVRKYGYSLKINTVVNRENFNEDMNSFIQSSQPVRWKVFQVLPIKGQNDKTIEDLEISEEQFNYFLSRHKGLHTADSLVSESNDEMKGSYVMVDPAGRFFDNVSGSHNYSKPILEVGVDEALKDVEYDFQKFKNRGGIYDWEIDKKITPYNITISGEVASGKSTVGKLLAEKLQYSFKSIGEETRVFAEQRGLSIVEFQKECLLNPKLDEQIDSQFSKECNAKKYQVIDYRLGFRFIHSALHIFLKVSEETAINRLQKANRENETYHTVQKRNDSFKRQFENTYGVDLTNKGNYDFIIDVDDKKPEEIVEEIMLRINRSYKNERYNSMVHSEVHKTQDAVAEKHYE